MKPKTSLAFQCDQDLNSMSETEKGKYCHQCEKHLVDYSTMAFGDFKKLEKKGQLSTCGIFTENQVNPDLIAELQIPRSVKRIAFFGSIMFSIATIDAQTQNSDSLRLELLDQRDTTSIFKYEQERVYKTESTCSKPTIETKEKKEEKAFKRKLFLNRRFPFLHYKKVSTRPKMVFGGRF